MNQDPSSLNASDALVAMRAGTLTSEALARACLARVEARDGDVRAWTVIDSAHVLAQAREIDKGPPTRALYGLPIGIKDVMLTADLPTQYNSPLYRGWHPRLDASCVRLLRQAGALVFGKADTVEFAATGRKALTRNPHALGHTPGGSSSGSAAAVADGHVPLALGTQTGGSIIRPASFCGVWGFKPTWGIVSTEGCKSYAPTLDTVGWFARSSADLSLLLDVLDPEPVTVAPLFSLTNARIALCRTPMWARAEPATQQAFDAAARLLRGAGAQVDELTLPPPFECLAALQMLIMRAECRPALLAEYRDHPDTLEPSLRDQVLNTDATTRQQLRAAYDTAAACRARFDALAEPYDAVLAPSTVGTAPEGLGATGDLLFNGLWTLLHVPCVNVPGWRGANGLPVGLTLTGARYADRRVLAVAHALEAVLARQQQ